jgi:hypothetical protein
MFFFKVSVNYNFSHTVRWKFNAVKHTGYKTAPEQLYILPLGHFREVILVRRQWKDAKS